MAPECDEKIVDVGAQVSGDKDEDCERPLRSCTSSLQRRRGHTVLRSHHVTSVQAMVQHGMVHHDSNLAGKPMTGGSGTLQGMDAEGFHESFTEHCCNVAGEASTIS